MADQNGSKFYFYSKGIVVQDKQDGSDYILVYPVEEMPNVNGKIADHAETFKTSMPDSKGVARASNVKSSATVKARWVPLGQSNRMTAPDVCANESVMLFKYADTEDVYWTTDSREPGIRRLETVCYMYGDKAAPLQAFDKKSSYWVEVSTKKKYIHVHTANSDGEPFQYDIHLDTKHGSLEITDDAGNSLLLDSEQGLIKLKPRKKFQVETEEIEFIATKSYKVKTQGVTYDATSLNLRNMLKIGNSVEASGNISTTGTIDANGNVTAAGFVQK